MMKQDTIEKLMDAMEWEAVEADPQTDLPFVTHEGVLELGGFRFRAYTLSNGVRILDAEDVNKFFGIQ